MQPGGKCGLSAKSADLAVQLKKGLLRQIFGLGGVPRHSETKRIHAPFMKSIQAFKCERIPCFCSLDSFGFAESETGRGLLLTGRFFRLFDWCDGTTL